MKLRRIDTHARPRVWLVPLLAPALVAAFIVVAGCTKSPEEQRMDEINQKLERYRQQKAEEERNPGLVTSLKYAELYTGMSYGSAVEVIGTSGKEVSSSNLAGYATVMYEWVNPDGSNMNLTFQNNRLVSKAQSGLP
jgi:hypothetical protein